MPPSGMRDRTRFFEQGSRGGAPWLTVVAFVAFAVGTEGCKKKPLEHPDGGAEVILPKAPPLTPGERTAPVAIVAPAPLPEGVPLKRHVSPSGKGPTEYVDQAGLRSLLYFKKYALLEAAFEDFQHRVETRLEDEELIYQAAASFESSEDELREQLDGWVAASPASFAPYLARANHFSSAGWDSRGTGWAAETSRESFARMTELHTRAKADADKALELRPKLQPAFRIRVKLAKGGSNLGDAKLFLDRATKDCPACFRVRYVYAFGLAPRWGGSYPAMDAFAKTAPVDKNPRLAILAGLADFDRSTAPHNAKKYDEALASIDAATKHYDAAAFSNARAETLAAKEDFTGALTAIDHAIDLAPSEPEFHIRRGTILSGLKRWKEAGEELLTGLRVDRTSALARAYHRTIVDWLVWQGWQEKLAGKRDLALDMLEVALDLAPTDQGAAGTYYQTVIANVADPTKELPRLEAQIKAKPDDFRAHQELDYALAKLGRFKDVVQMWDGYIGRHPKDGRAHLERGGAHNRLGDRAASHTDAQAACNLGIAQGCIFAARASK